MANVSDNNWDEEYSVIGDEGDVGFLDFEHDKSLHGFEPLNEGPVVISTPYPFSHGKPQSALIGVTAADSITIRNTTSDPVELWGVRIFSSNPRDSFVLSLMKPPRDNFDEAAMLRFVGSDALEDRVLQPLETLTIWLSCKPEEIGMHTSVVHFDVGDEKIERVAFLLAEDKISQALASDKPYARNARRKKQFGLDQYVVGSRPPRYTTQGFKHNLPKFAIPTDVRELIESKQVPDVIMQGLNNRNYVNYFSTLLVMEEIRLEEDMRGHDMECVTMRRRGNHFLSLEVPGLAERRPSLVYGDYIFAKPVIDGPVNDCRPYQGYIHRVEADEIFLRFANELHQQHQDGDLYNVRFAYNRVSMRRLYQAVHTAENLGPALLFPSQLPKRRFIKKTPIVPLNSNLNREQLLSIENILGCSGAPPYVIHGPPGTGKTVTVVEAILQLYRSRKSARILVCASSNSATDHILEKLIGKEAAGVEESKIFRLNATSRPYEDLKTDYVRFCFFEDMVFKCPPLRALSRYRIIISTYMSAYLLYAEGIRRGHFTHIFLDEAGQSSEPETMIPISNLCRMETVIVLAGDPMQLGPVVYSKDAECYGLGKSYLQRLFECDFYENEDQNYVTKLVRNYRCHPPILELPSKLFYKGELIASKGEIDSSIYDLLDLPNKKFPVLFIGIQGCDEREGSNPSWFNRIEVSKVVELIRKLRRTTELSESDIGVITPYRQQVLKLKKALDYLEMPDLKVGSVEQFQGQERQVIIISTVRSTVKHNEFDRVHNLGFLSNPRRFNVATTRARSLLVIIGNPHIISKDPHWNKLLRHCAENGSYQGCPLPPPEMDYHDDETTGSYGGDIPKQYTNEVEWGEDIPKQYTNEVEWGEDIPKQYTNEVDIPKQYTNEVEWGEDIPKQYTNEVEWGEDISKQYTDEVEWGEDVPKPKNTNRDEWGEDIPKKHSSEVEWDEDIIDQDYKEAGWGEENLKKYSYEAGWGEDNLKEYSNESKWGEDNLEEYSDEAGWGAYKPNRGSGKVEWGEEYFNAAETASKVVGKDRWN